MPINTKIQDPLTKNAAEVHASGYLKTGNVEYNTPSAAVLALTGTAYNLIEPKSYCSIVIDGLIINATKTVSATNGAAVRIYEAAAVDSTTPTRDIINIDVLKHGTPILSGLNILANSGVWVNADTDDATVNITILYYYIRND